MFPVIGENQGGMIELILDENVKFTRQFETDVIQQMRSVTAPGQGNDLNHVPL